MNGNMFAGLFRDRLILKLPQPVRMKLFELPGAAPFEPMPGRVMGEFVVLRRAADGALAVAGRLYVE